MLNILSLLLGLVAAILAFFGLLIGIINWVALPIGFLGLVFGQLSSSNFGRNFCIVVMIVSGLRLMAGGGIF